MHTKIEEHLNSVYNHLFPENSKVIVALSGGVDSVVLLQTLKNSRPDLHIIAAHCNHNLREQSKEDEDFCKRLCEDNDIHFEVTDLDVVRFCSENKTGTEEGARILRHRFFEELKWTHNTDYLALGHHANDRAETIFFNLLRGTGLAGLSAMKRADNERGIYRPLLGLQKNDILGVAKLQNWNWVEDHTNHESEYDRNWLRNVVFPLLGERRQGLVKILNRTAEQFDLINDFVELQAEKYIRDKSSCNSAGNFAFFDIADYLSEHKALQNAVMLRMWIDLYGSSSNFSNKIIKEFSKWINSDLSNGKSVEFGKSYRLVNRNGLLGVKPNDKTNSLDINDKLLSLYKIRDNKSGLSIR